MTTKDTKNIRGPLEIDEFTKLHQAVTPYQKLCCMMNAMTSCLSPSYDHQVQQSLYPGWMQCWRRVLNRKISYHHKWILVVKSVDRKLMVPFRMSTTHDKPRPELCL